jgi:sugar phosphate permease
MKVAAYVLTFVGFAVLYMLRQGYSFSKPYVRAHFHYSILFVSMIDACLYGGMGIGYLLRYKLIDERRPMKHFLCMSLSMCLLFSFLPLASLLTPCVPAKTI